jgi:hypothetical protein
LFQTMRPSSVVQCRSIKSPDLNHCAQSRADPCCHSHRKCTPNPHIIRMQPGKSIALNSELRMSACSSTGHFWGSHLPRSRWSDDQLSIMMYIEVRLRCSQPPSHGFSGSLRTFGKQCVRSPEMRLQMAMLLRQASRETRSRRERARFPVPFLYRPLAVTWCMESA